MLTELKLPIQPEGEGGQQLAAELAPALAGAYPHLAEMLGELVLGRDCAYAAGFLPGLDLVLDGLEARWRAVGGLG